MVSKNIYVEKVIPQIARILGNQDRMPFSPSYGCFDRIYWLDKVIDFPTSLAQYGVHSLALVYKYEFVNNQYYQQKKIKDWAIAGIEYWMKIQHSDGSFDEYYPNERGWAGPTGFLLYAMIESYELLKDEFPKEMEAPFFDACQRAARYLAVYDEVSVLANHHVMAALPILKAHYLLDDNNLLDGYNRKIEDYLDYHTKEGWSYEYGGADPGYLSATISFFSKIYKLRPSDKVLEILKQAIEFASYFIYPNKFYAGTIGSRQTLHFYPHGFEIMSHQIPLAGTMAEKMLEGLSEGKLVTPEIMADRYLYYRTNEYLLSYLDHKPRLESLPDLPYQRSSFIKYFPLAKIEIRKNPDYYSLVNLGKGGVIKIFDLKKNELLYNDCGVIAILDKSNQVVTSQWIENDYKLDVSDNCLTVEGHLNRIPLKYFTPFKNIIFRSFLLLFGWNTRLSYWIKGFIRKLLVVGTRLVPIRIKRSISFADNLVTIEDLLTLEGNRNIKSLFVGDEFSVRFVPQSLYFQSQELGIYGYNIEKKYLKIINNSKQLFIKRTVDILNNKISFSIEGDK